MYYKITTCSDKAMLLVVNHNQDERGKLTTMACHAKYPWGYLFIGQSFTVQVNHIKNRHTLEMSYRKFQNRTDGKYKVINHGYAFECVRIA